MEAKIIPVRESDRPVAPPSASVGWEDRPLRRQEALLEFVVAAGWGGTTAKRLARLTLGEPEFPAKENARLSAIYRDLHELNRQGKVVCVSSSRPMEWAASGAHPSTAAGSEGDAKKKTHV